MRQIDTFVCPDRFTQVTTRFLRPLLAMNQRRVRLMPFMRNLVFSHFFTTGYRVFYDRLWDFLCCLRRPRKQSSLPGTPLVRVLIFGALAVRAGRRCEA